MSDSFFFLASRTLVKAI